MSIKAQLAEFYTKEAKKYTQTRKKHRSDGQHFVDAITQLNLPKPKILELGCGGARFLDYFKQHYHGDFDYCGVDLSSGLLHYAQKYHPEQRFVQADMTTWMAGQEQEQRDVILACASFQHLPTQKERKMLIKNAYKALKYHGLLLMTNRAFSERFLKTHPTIFIKSGLKSLFSFGQWSWRDVFIPWKTAGQIHYRYYHLFSLSELRELLMTGGFVIKQLSYLDKQGLYTDDRKRANNSFFLAQKTVFLGA